MTCQPAVYWRADGGIQNVPCKASTSEQPAWWWRADGGLQEVVGPPEHIVAEQAAMFCYPNHPGYMPFWGQQQGYMQGPIGVGGFCSPPPTPYGSPPPFGYPLPPYPQLPPTPPVSPDQDKEKKKKDKKKKKEKKDNPYAPPKLPDGANYMFDHANNHLELNIFNKAAPVWESKYSNQTLKFKRFRVSANFTVRMVIEHTLRKSGEECEDWACTEVQEVGDGEWKKGTTIDYDSDKANGTLNSMGWSPKRGDKAPPVWLVVHKVDFK